jgi:hypothetical protein
MHFYVTKKRRRATFGRPSNKEIRFFRHYAKIHLSKGSLYITSIEVALNRLSKLCEWSPYGAMRLQKMIGFCSLIGRLVHPLWKPHFQNAASHHDALASLPDIEAQIFRHSEGTRGFYREHESVGPKGILQRYMALHEHHR